MTNKSVLFVAMFAVLCHGSTAMALEPMSPNVKRADLVKRLLGDSADEPKIGWLDCNGFEELCNMNCEEILCQRKPVETPGRLQRNSGARRSHYRQSGAAGTSGGPPYAGGQDYLPRGPDYPNDISAEEFPWESTTQGGFGASLYPVTRQQQTAQGVEISAMYRRSDIRNLDWFEPHFFSSNSNARMPYCEALEKQPPDTSICDRGKANMRKKPDTDPIKAAAERTTEPGSRKGIQYQAHGESGKAKFGGTTVLTRQVPTMIDRAGSLQINPKDLSKPFYDQYSRLCVKSIATGTAWLLLASGYITHWHHPSSVHPPGGHGHGHGRRDLDEVFPRAAVGDRSLDKRNVSEADIINYGHDNGTVTVVAAPQDEPVDETGISPHYNVTGNGTVIGNVPSQNGVNTTNTTVTGYTSSGLSRRGVLEWVNTINVPPWRTLINSDCVVPADVVGSILKYTKEQTELYAQDIFVC